MRTRKPMYHAVTSSCRQRWRPGYMSLTFQRYIQIQATLAVVPGCSRQEGWGTRITGLVLHCICSTVTIENNWCFVRLFVLVLILFWSTQSGQKIELATGGTISWRQGAELHSQHTRNTGVMTVVILALCREREKAGLQGRWSSEAIVSHSWLHIPACVRLYINNNRCTDITDTSPPHTCLNAWLLNQRWFTWRLSI